MYNRYYRYNKDTGGQPRTKYAAVDHKKRKEMHFTIVKNQLEMFAINPFRFLHL